MGGSMSQAVVIRKFEDGIAIYLDPDMDFEALLDQVGRKFSSAARFFRDAYHTAFPASDCMHSEGRKREGKSFCQIHA